METNFNRPRTKESFYFHPKDAGIGSKSGGSAV